MSVMLKDSTIAAIEQGVATYTAESREKISDAMVDMIIKMLVSKYIQLRAYPSTYTDDEISAEVNNYFADNAEIIAFRIPSVVGQMGMEGETAHTENGTTHKYTSGDPLSNILPDVVQIAKWVAL